MRGACDSDECQRGNENEGSRAHVYIYTRIRRTVPGTRQAREGKRGVTGRV
jgi:hypothetical protein